MVWTGPLLPVDADGRTLHVQPDLTDDDVQWLNEHAASGDLSIRYVRDPSPPTGWITLASVRG